MWPNQAVSILPKLTDGLYWHLCTQCNQDGPRALSPTSLTNYILSWTAYMQTSACNRHNSEHDRTHSPVLTSDLKP